MVDRELEHWSMASYLETPLLQGLRSLYIPLLKKENALCKVFQPGSVFSGLASRGALEFPPRLQSKHFPLHLGYPAIYLPVPKRVLLWTRICSKADQHLLSSLNRRLLATHSIQNCPLFPQWTLRTLDAWVLQTMQGLHIDFHTTQFNSKHPSQFLVPGRLPFSSTRNWWTSGPRVP